MLQQQQKRFEHYVRLFLSKKKKILIWKDKSRKKLEKNDAMMMVKCEVK